MSFLQRSRLTLLCGIGLLLTCTSLAADDRPNILLVMVDDMGYSDIGCYGGEIRTPTLDGLAENGVRLAQFFNCAQCCPTRAALMTGLYPHQAGVGDMNEEGTNNEFWKRVGSSAYLGLKTRGIVTLPEVLRAAGYQTFMAGKWHLGKAPECWPHSRGFDRSFALIGGACEQFTGYRSWQQKGPITLFVENGQKVEKLPSNFYSTDTFTDQTLRFIDAADPKQPWFGYLAFTAPHWPIQAHEADVAKYAETYVDGPSAIRQRRFERLKQLGLVPETARLPQFDESVTLEALQAKKETRDRWMRTYAAMIDCVDQNLARVVKRLRERGQFDNTLILFLSDNGSDTVRGPLWGQVSNTPFRRFKVSVNDGGIASPLIAHWPNGIPREQRGRIVRDVGHVIDIHATCLDAARTQQPKSFRDHDVLPAEGLSLLTAFRGKGSLPPDRVLCWERMGNEAVRQGHWKLVRAYGASTEDGNITSTGPRTGEWELFDTATDPGETTNLAGQHPERVQSLARLFESWATRVGVVPREEIVKLMETK
ncbi:MAG: arylsulfatase [Verrucomicrobia bacterium]|nr:arylsulfatase [Verrucomicrobiota bacterium]MBM4216533.1 arylsulfatase [Gammaproteobacteria bacterium]